jgi:hypothetical protein
MSFSDLPTHRRFTEERRIWDRVDMTVPAKLIHDDGAIDGEIENISASGASFCTRDETIAIAPGDHVVVRAVLETREGERLIERRARVARCDDFFDGEHDVYTYGVAFDEPLSDSWAETDGS